MTTRRALAVLMMSVAVAGVGVGYATTTTFAAAECTYDGPPTRRVCAVTDVTLVVVSLQATGSSEGFASPTVWPRRTSTTAALWDHATDYIVEAAG